jgi:hypothetical protein
MKNMLKGLTKTQRRWKDSVEVNGTMISWMTMSGLYYETTEERR